MSQIKGKKKDIIEKKYIYIQDKFYQMGLLVKEKIKVNL